MKKDFLTTGDRTIKTSRYKQDDQSQSLLLEMNVRLQPLENEVVNKLDDFSHIPILFISYLPRSGSTLLSQLLIATKRFNYISNFQSRFWRAPYVGSVLEKSLFDKFQRTPSFDSDYGTTKELFEPSEFTYLWEHWLNISEDQSHTLTEIDCKGIKKEKLRKELNALRSISPYPLLFKKEWLGMNAGLFLENIPNCKFVHIERNSYDLAISILKARKDVFGDINSWWAAKPSNYLQLKEHDPYRQVAGQISGIRNDVNRWIKLYPDKFMFLRYESLIENVRKQIGAVAGFTGLKISDRHIDKLPKTISPKMSVNGGYQFSKKKILEALKEFDLNG